MLNTPRSLPALSGLGRTIDDEGEVTGHERQKFDLATCLDAVAGRTYPPCSVRQQVAVPMPKSTEARHDDTQLRRWYRSGQHPGRCSSRAYEGDGVDEHGRGHGRLSGPAR